MELKLSLVRVYLVSPTSGIMLRKCSKMLIDLPLEYYGLLVSWSKDSYHELRWSRKSFTHATWYSFSDCNRAAFLVLLICSFSSASFLFSYSVSSLLMMFSSALTMISSLFSLGEGALSIPNYYKGGMA